MRMHERAARDRAPSAARTKPSAAAATGLVRAEVRRDQISSRAPMDASPRVTAQRQRLRALFGSAASLEPHAGALPAGGSAGPTRGEVVQRVLNNALPVGKFHKSDLSAYRGDIENSRQTFAADWNLIRVRALFLSGRHVPLPQVDAFRAAHAQFEVIDWALQSRFSDTKRDRFRAAYDAIRAAEQAGRFALAQGEIAGYSTLDQLVLQANSAVRIITDLEGRTSGALPIEPLFSDAIMRQVAQPQEWSFARGAGPNAVDWRILFATQGNPAHAIGVVPNLIAHTIAVTISNYVLPALQSRVYEREIADEITFAFRRALAVGGGDRLQAGGGAGAVLGLNDLEKIRRLNETLQRLQADKALYDAAPDNPMAQFRWRRITAEFDRQVVAMNLGDAATRRVFEAANNLEGPTRRKAVAHGISHEVNLRAHNDVAPDAAPFPDDIIHLITPDLTEHLLAVEENGAAQFPMMGLSGGHDDERLHAWVRQNPRYHLVPGGRVDHDVMIAGRSYTLSMHRYEQYRWSRAAAPPAHPLERPPHNTENWVRSQVPKTTVDNLVGFLHEARAAFLAWRGAPARQGARAGDTFGRVVLNQQTDPAARQDGAMEFAGYIRADPLRGGRRIETLFAAPNFMRD